jgi:hypothetical protein
MLFMVALIKNGNSQPLYPRPNNASGS